MKAEPELKIIIFGNSSSGKSTLAKKLSREKNLARLDLDTVAWQSENPTTRRSISNNSCVVRSQVVGQSCPATATPIIASLVTSSASFSSVKLPVPAGRFGMIR